MLMGCRSERKVRQMFLKRIFHPIKDDKKQCFIGGSGHGETVVFLNATDKEYHALCLIGQNLRKCVHLFSESEGLKHICCSKDVYRSFKELKD